MTLALVVAPILLGFRYVCNLPAFVATAQQDHNLVTVFGAVNAISWSKVDYQLQDALSNGFALAEVPRPQTGDPRVNSDPAPQIFEPVKPDLKRVFSISRNVVPYSFGPRFHRRFRVRTSELPASVDYNLHKPTVEWGRKSEADCLSSPICAPQLLILFLIVLNLVNEALIRLWGAGNA